MLIIFIVNTISVAAFGKIIKRDLGVGWNAIIVRSIMNKLNKIRKSWKMAFALAANNIT